MSFRKVLVAKRLEQKSIPTVDKYKIQLPLNIRHENVFKIFLSKSFVRRGRLSVHALQMKFLILGGIITAQTCFQKECRLPALEVEAMFPLSASSISFWRKYALRIEKTPL